MLERLLLNSPWIAIGLAVLVFAANHYTAWYEAYLYQTSLKGFVEYQGAYKLTPELEALIARRRIISGRFAAWVAVLIGCTLAVWWLCLRQYDRPDVFLFLMGGFVLDEGAEVIRQYRAIMIMREARRRGGLQGKVSYTRQLTYMQTVYDRYGLVLLYFFLFLVTGSWFLFGGAVACLATSRHFRDWVVIKA
jgi:hypothetical protein